MAYLDDRSRKLLMKIVDYPTISGKELQEQLNLSRKQLSYTMYKVNEYLIENGLAIIERKRNGRLTIPSAVIEKYKNDISSYEEVEYIYSENERHNLIVLILLSHHRELSTYDFTHKLKISRNTFLLDVKKIQSILQKENEVNITYSRKDGYTVVGNEYAKREILIGIIRKVLNMPNGEEVIKKVCKIETVAINEIKKDIISIESQLEIQFTDERLKELPYILHLIIGRIQAGRLLDIIPESFHHTVGTKEYSATSNFASKYSIEFQEERMFLTSQIQISNLHYLKGDEYRIEKKLLIAVDKMLNNFEKICCVQIKNRDTLREALLQHCRPALYRIKYNYHIENSILEMVLPQHSHLNELVRRCSKPIEELLGYAIPDEELVYLTVLFGGWLRKEGKLEIIEKKKKAVVVCTNGISVSNFLFITLQEYLPEIEFITCLSIRGFTEYEGDYDIVFSTVRMDCDVPQFIVKPFLDDYSRLLFRQKVLKELGNVNLYHIEVPSILNIIDKYATVHEREELTQELKRYLNIDTKKYDIKYNFNQKALIHSGVELTDLLTLETIIVENNELSWKEAIIHASHPLLLKKYIEKRYINRIINLIENEKPFMLIADGVMIAHAGVEDGVNKLSMSLLRLPNKISINGYMEADIIIILATPDKVQHITALNKLVEVTESNKKMSRIRLSKSIKEIINILKK